MRNFVIFLVFIAIIFIFSGCATLPMKVDFSKAKTFEVPFDPVWSAIIETFADLNLPIKTIEKDSGIISTDWMTLIGDARKYCACGNPGSLLAEGERFGTFNVFAKKISSNQVEVTVNTEFKRTIMSMLAGSTSPPTTFPPTKCNSLGVLEADMFELIEKKLKSAQ